MTGTKVRAEIAAPENRQWQEPRLTYVGHLADIVQGGGGKLSVTSVDPGEVRCEKPHCFPAK